MMNLSCERVNQTREAKGKGMDRRVPFETLRKRKLIMEIYKRYRYMEYIFRYVDPKRQET